MDSFLNHQIDPAFTLVVVPVIYTLLDDIGGRLFGRRAGAATPDQQDALPGQVKM